METVTGLAYLLELEVEWLEPAAVLDRMLFVKQDAELQAVRMAQTRAKGAKA